MPLRFLPERPRCLSEFIGHDFGRAAARRQARKRRAPVVVAAGIFACRRAGASSPAGRALDVSPRVRWSLASSGRLEARPLRQTKMSATTPPPGGKPESAARSGAVGSSVRASHPGSAPALARSAYVAIWLTGAHHSLRWFLEPSARARMAYTVPGTKSVSTTLCGSVKVSFRTHTPGTLLTSVS